MDHWRAPQTIPAARTDLIEIKQKTTYSSN
jgi:hypothetical protein